MYTADFAKVTCSSRAKHHEHPETDRVEEMDEGILQNSSTESICSPQEFDAGDETMVSQDTAATDVSHIALSMASIVCVICPLSSESYD